MARGKLLKSIAALKSFPQVIGGVRVPQPEETLGEEIFDVSEVVRHGFPDSPTALAVDAVQGLLAIGNRSGQIVVLGKPGVERPFSHEKACAVTHLAFVVNKGLLISVTEDGCLHIWDLHQKKSTIVQSLPRERFNTAGSSLRRITCLFVPFESEWIYVGIESGDIFPVSTTTFEVSSYWSDVDKSASIPSKPGPVRAISQHPHDESKLLLVYDDFMVLWNLKKNNAVFNSSVKSPRSLSWLSNGKQFMTAEQNGMLSVWNAENGSKLHSLDPHDQHSGSTSLNRRPRSGPPCEKIHHLQWLSSKESPWIIFSGGSPGVEARKTVTVMRDNTCVHTIRFDHPIVDLCCLTAAPLPNEVQDPHTLVVLLEKGLEVVDLLSPTLARYSVPYSTTLSSSPVKSTLYECGIPAELHGQLFSVGTKNLDQLASSKQWPLMGGRHIPIVHQSHDILLTGHADGSVRFWDVSSVALTSMYTLDTSLFFELLDGHRSLRTSMASRSPSPSRSMFSDVENPFAVRHMSLCTDSNTLILSSESSYVLLCRLAVRSVELEIPTVQVCIEEGRFTWNGVFKQGPKLSTGRRASKVSQSSVELQVSDFPVPIRWAPYHGAKIQSPGFHAILCVQLVTPSGSIDTSSVSCLHYSHGLGLLAIGSSSGLCVVDVLQEKILLCSPVEGIACLIKTPSPKPNQTKRKKSGGCGKKSSTTDQPSYEEVMSATGGEWMLGAPCSPAAVDGEGCDSQTMCAVTAMTFADTFSVKNDCQTYSSLWFSTSVGSLFGLTVQSPSSELPPTVSPGRVIWNLQASVLHVDTDSLNTLSILDNRGQPLCSSTAAVSDTPATDDGDDDDGSEQCHFAVVTSDRFAWVYALPSHGRKKYSIANNKLVLTSAVVNIGGAKNSLSVATLIRTLGQNAQPLSPTAEGTCLVSLTADQDLLIHSLPNMTPLKSVSLALPETVWPRMARTFTCARGGQALFMSSPSQIQRLSLLAKNVLDVPDSLPDVYIHQPAPKQKPRPPPTFFQRFVFWEPADKEFSRTRLFSHSGAASGTGDDLHARPSTLSKQGPQGNCGLMPRAPAMCSRTFCSIIDHDWERTSSLDPAAHRFSRRLADFLRLGRPGLESWLLNLKRRLSGDPTIIEMRSDHLDKLQQTTGRMQSEASDLAHLAKRLSCQAQK